MALTDATLHDKGLGRSELQGIESRGNATR